MRDSCSGCQRRGSLPVEISMRCAPVVVDGRQGNTGVRHMHQCVRRLPAAGGLARRADCVQTVSASREKRCRLRPASVLLPTHQHSEQPNRPTRARRPCIRSASALAPVCMGSAPIGLWHLTSCRPSQRSTSCDLTVFCEIAFSPRYFWRSCPLSHFLSRFTVKVEDIGRDRNFSNARVYNGFGCHGENISPRILVVTRSAWNEKYRLDRPRP